MKNYLPFLIIPFTAFASYDIDSVEDCEAMKSDLRSQVQSQKNALPSLINDIIYTRSAVFSLNEKAQHFQALADGNSSDVDVYNAYNYAANSCRVSYQSFSPYSDSLLQDYFTISNRIYALSGSIDSINCLSCSVDSPSTNCCDFTEILQAIGDVSNGVNIAIHELSVISNQLNSLEYTNFLLEHGFGDITNNFNLLNYNLSHGNISADASIDSLYWFSLRKMKGTSNSSLSIGNQSRSSQHYLPQYNGFLSSYWWELDFIGQTQISLNNYLYRLSFLQFPILTNTVGAIRRDFSSYSNEATNFFSFFRGEIGVRGVLEDWTSEQVDGTYHDFLTNHYINVVRGGSLSGFQSEKTNWFARIETLLASLVFLDSSDTNSYNEAAASVSNGLSRVKDEFDNKLDGVSSASSTQIELVSDIEHSMYESLQSFSRAFSSASLPSTVQLLYVHKASGAKSLPSSDTVDVTVPVEGDLMDFIEIIRSCTTLCWVFFGLWFMFKFSVWTVKKIYMLIRYIIDFFNMVAGGK